MGSTTSGAKVNRAVIYSEPGTIKTEVVELPIEKPGPGQVLVRLQVLSLNSHISLRMNPNSLE
jgi:NADPH-dependent curcumin reductase CurA